MKISVIETVCVVLRECRYAKQTMNYSALYILGMTCRFNDLSDFTFMILYYFITSCISTMICFKKIYSVSYCILQRGQLNSSAHLCFRIGIDKFLNSVPAVYKR